MNYIELIKNFWLQHNAYSLTVTETALYFYLLETNNLCRWADTFNRNNNKVLADLGIASPKTLSKARNRLKQVGLIDFKTKNGSPNVSYTLVNFTEVSAEVGTEVREQVSAEVDTEIIKHKQKHRDNSGELFPLTLTSKKKPPKQKTGFIPPTAEEVKEYFRGKLPDWETQADIFYNHFSGLGWRTATGAKIERWDSRANLWIIEKKQQSNGGTEIKKQNSRDADKATKARTLLDEYAAIDQGGYAGYGKTEIPDL